MRLNEWVVVYDGDLYFSQRLCVMRNDSESFYISELCYFFNYWSPLRATAVCPLHFWAVVVCVEPAHIAVSV